MATAEAVPESAARTVAYQRRLKRTSRMGEKKKNVKPGMLAIAAITAIASITGFTFFFFSPILDVRFSRRWYATVLAALSGTASAVAILSLHHLLVLQIALVIAGASGLSSSALGGWLSNITPNEQKNPLSKWMNIAVFSGTGLTSVVGGEIVRR